MPRLLVRAEDGTLVPLADEIYGSEDELQSLIEEHPELLLGDAAASGDNVKYLLVRREAGVPETEGAADRWFLDHVFLDGEGIPTLVEVKRSTDTRIRREVVGQMLDYAANILANWPPTRMREEFEATCAAAVPTLDPVRAVRDLADADYDAYWNRVKANLDAKRLRLIFVADQIPTSLQTVVEFLNEQLRSTEVLAVEVRRHASDGHTVVSTTLIGRTPEARAAKSVTETREWTSDLALEELRRRELVDAAIVAERILSWGIERGLPVWWGSGAKIGYQQFVIADARGNSGRPFGFSTDGKLDLYPSEMRRLGPFDQEEARLEFLQKVAAAIGESVAAPVASQSFKSFRLDRFLQSERYDALIAALDAFLERVGNG